MISRDGGPGHYKGFLMSLSEYLSLFALLFKYMARFGLDRRKTKRNFTSYIGIERRRLRVKPSSPGVSQERARKTVLFYCLLITFVLMTLYYFVMDYVGLRPARVLPVCNGCLRASSDLVIQMILAVGV